MPTETTLVPTRFITRNYFDIQALAEASAAVASVRSPNFIIYFGIVMYSVIVNCYFYQIDVDKLIYLPVSRGVHPVDMPIHTRTNRFLPRIIAFMPSFNATVTCIRSIIRSDNRVGPVLLLTCWQRGNHQVSDKYQSGNATIYNTKSNNQPSGIRRSGRCVTLAYD